MRRMNKMKKGYYIVTKDMRSDELADPGVYKKIQSQLKFFAKSFEVSLIEAYYKTNWLRKLLSRLPLFPNLFSINKRKYNWDVDFIYFRLNMGDRHIIRFFRYVKKVNPVCKIIVELPDYPMSWNSFLRKWHQKPFIFKHRYCENRLHKYVDRIVTFSPFNQIYGIPTIITENGVDIDSVKPRCLKREGDGAIHVISVSTMLYWQGIDRFLLGMADYYKNERNPKIVLHLVGDGQSRKEYETIVERNNLFQFVIFHGTKIGQDLDDIYDICDVGLAEIGRFRVQKNQKRSTSIKVREYWAKGLPIICSSRINEPDNSIEKYVFHVPEDDSPVNISAFVKFYHDCNANGMSFTSNEIRSFAVRYCSYDKTMSPIINYIYE